MNIKKFLKECGQREVFKLLSIYIVSSWVILQVLAVVADPLGLPDKSISVLILLLIIGFPIYIIYIWRSRLSKSWKSEEDDSSDELLNKRKFRQMYFASVGIILFLAGLSVTFIFNNTISSNVSLKRIASNDKIAVLRFENLTTDNNLDVIGEMAANWISHGITENNAGQIISQEIVKDYSDAMKTQNKKLTSSEILTKFFNPGKRVIGTYFLDNDELIFQSSVIDGLSGKVLISLERVACNSDSPLKCIEELRQKIVGYLIVEQDGKLYLENKPPKYEAYKALLEAKNSKKEGNLAKHLELLNKAIAIDSEYFEPQSLRISYYYNQGSYTIADSLIDNITLKSGISERQQNLNNLYKSAIEGNNRKVYLFNDYEYKIIPDDMETNTSQMVIALQFVNKPEDVEAIFKSGTIEELGIENCSLCIDRIHIMSMAYNELGKFNKAIKLLEPHIDIIEERFFLMPIFKAYANTNRKNAIDELLTKLKLKISSNDWLYINLFTARQFLLLNQKELAISYLNSIINTNNKEGNEFIIAEAYSELEKYKEAEILYSNLLKEDPVNPQLIVGLSRCYFKNGKMTESDLLIERLEKLRAPYQYGTIDYRLAQIYASRNDEEKTLDHLLKSIAQGNFYINETFKNSTSFIPFSSSEKWNDILTYWH